MSPNGVTPKPGEIDTSKMDPATISLILTLISTFGPVIANLLAALFGKKPVAKSTLDSPEVQAKIKELADLL